MPVPLAGESGLARMPTTTQIPMPTMTTAAAMIHGSQEVASRVWWEARKPGSDLGLWSSFCSCAGIIEIVPACAPRHQTGLAELGPLNRLTKVFTAHLYLDAHFRQARAHAFGDPVTERLFTKRLVGISCQ